MSAVDENHGSHELPVGPSSQLIEELSLDLLVTCSVPWESFESTEDVEEGSRELPVGFSSQLVKKGCPLTS